MKLFVNLLLLFLYINLIKCTDYGVKGGSSTNHGIKSYGGVFQNNNSPGVHHTYQQMNQQVPMYHQWNYNNQPHRTYGGVIQQNPQQSSQGLGWFGNGNQYQNEFGNPTLPNLHPLFLPNYAPPVHYANTLPFPNYNQFPSSNFGGSVRSRAPERTNTKNDGRYPINPSNNKPSTFHQHPGNFGIFPDITQYHNNDGQKNSNHNTNYNQNTYIQPGRENTHQHPNINSQFATNAFFNPTDINRKSWTDKDENEWQATTKAPYFENKVPGLPFCTLPAAAVLGATTAFKISSLFPLNVPAGKPVLSCNATDLLQTQINLNGIIYDCSRSYITVSCPRIDSNNIITDECHGENLECDVRITQNLKSVSCTNGTLISNHPIICKSATLLENKNVLNCLYATGMNSDFPEASSPPTFTSKVYEATTSKTSVIPLKPVTENIVGDFQTRHSENTETSLMNGVKTAMKSIFPHELLSKASEQMYLPSKFFEMAEIPKELKNHLVGIFPHDLFAISQTGDLNHHDNDKESRLSPSQTSIKNRNLLTQQWDINANKKIVNAATFIKISNQLPQRFGTTENDVGNDRLIFSP